MSDLFDKIGYRLLDNEVYVSHQYAGASATMDMYKCVKVTSFDVMLRPITLPKVTEPNETPVTYCWCDSLQNTCFFNEEEKVLYIKFVTGDIVSIHPDGSVAIQEVSDSITFKANTVRGEKTPSTIEIDTSEENTLSTADISRDYSPGSVSFTEQEEYVKSMKAHEAFNDGIGKIEDQGDTAVKNILKRAQENLQAKAEEKADKVSRPITIWSIETDQDHLFIVEKNEDQTELTRFDVSSLVFNEVRRMVESRNRSIVALIESIIDE